MVQQGRPVQTRTRPAPLLSPGTVGAYLVGRGLLPPGRPAQAVELGGGVSNIVLAVGPYVVKQALPRLRVADEWLAKQERALTEAEALRLAARLTPGRVPPLADVDPSLCAVTIGRAPEGWRTWKAALLDGEADPAVAEALGSILACWHAATAGDGDVARRFADWEAFEQLRVDPYHRTVARRHPDLAPAVCRLIADMAARRAALVHGDFSPKNVLLGDGGLWVLDFEVAHFGDPDFDLAFMLTHLALKAVHRPQRRQGYRRCAEAFLTAYRLGAPAFAPVPQRLARHLGCLMVARVDGKSPAEYLTAAGREEARERGRRLLLRPPDRWEGLLL